MSKAKWQAQIKFNSAVVFVKDIDLLKGFYKDVIGLEVESDFGNNMMFKNGFSLWNVGESHRMQKVVKQSANADNTFELYFETESITQVVEGLQHFDLTYIHELLEEPWGQKTLRFYDPERNIVEVAESLHGFVSRMETEGMSRQAIAEKTGIPLNNIVKILA